MSRFEYNEDVGNTFPDEGEAYSDGEEIEEKGGNKADVIKDDEERSEDEGVEGESKKTGV